MKSLAGAASRSWTDQRGIQAAELALVLPIFILVLFGTIDLGRGYFSWLIITNGAREGARTAIIGKTLDEPLGIAAKVSGAVYGLNVSRTDVGTCDKPPQAGSLCITTSLLPAASGAPITVYVTYQFKFQMLPDFMRFWNGSSSIPTGLIPLKAQATMRAE